MKLTKYKKIFLIIALTAFVVLLFNSNTAFAAINTGYLGDDAASNMNLTEAVEESTLIKLLAKLIYAIGRLLEWILGTIFKMLTGSSDFPWADKIVFNAVPLLDINFINPGGTLITGEDITEMTFVGKGEIQAVLKNLYATILTLAASFFGIIVLITAIRLVLTTIASEKAKYKKALVDWLVGFVMLFCIHYGISFIFYLNEQLVMVASDIVEVQIEQANVGVAEVQQDVLAKNLIDAAKEYNVTYNGQSAATIFEENIDLVVLWMNELASNESSKGLQEALAKDIRFFGNDSAIDKPDQIKNMAMMIVWATTPGISVKELSQIRNNIKIYVDYNELQKWGKKIICWNSFNMFGLLDMCDDQTIKEQTIEFNQALLVSDLEKIFKSLPEEQPLPYGMYDEFKNQLEPQGMHAILAAPYDIEGIQGENFVAQEDYAGNSLSKDEAKKYYLSRGASRFGYNSGMYDAHTNYYWSDVIDDMITLKAATNVSDGKTGIATIKKTRLISDLASYFRYNAYNKTLKSENITAVGNGDKIRIQNMIMYAVLVAQSLILFIAYIKRLFYVLLLAMMAPIVVVVDFFQKFGK